MGQSLGGLTSDGNRGGEVVAGGKDNAPGQMSRWYKHGASRSTLELVVGQPGVNNIVVPEVMIGNILFFIINPTNRQ